MNKRKSEVGITAVAQTLDGKETFETKKELFDYVFSQLFEEDWVINTVEGGIFLKIKTKKYILNSLNINIRTQCPNRISGLIKLNMNSEMLSDIDFRKPILRIFVNSSDGNKYEFNIITIDIDWKQNVDTSLGIWGNEHVNLNIKAGSVKILNED